MVTHQFKHLWDLVLEKVSTSCKALRGFSF